MRRLLIAKYILQSIEINRRVIRALRVRGRARLRGCTTGPNRRRWHGGAVPRRAGRVRSPTLASRRLLE